MAPRSDLGPRKRAVQLHAAIERLAGEIHSREILSRGDLQVGERLVVLEHAVVLGLNVLDQPRLRQEGVDLAVGGQELDVGNVADPVANPAVAGGRLVKVRAGPAAQILGLTDVDHPSLGVLHQVKAGRGGKLLHFLGWRDGRRFSVRHASLVGSEPD